MSFMRGLFMARSHLAFLVGLGIALGIVWRVERAAPASVTPGVVDFSALLSLGQTAEPRRATGTPLTPQEREWATVAWRYFEANTQAETGFVNSVDKYTSATLWDLGSYMMALLAACDLELIDAATCDGRLDKLVINLGKLPLVDGKLPNKAYNTASLKMVTYANAESKDGIGWSAIDIARLGVPLTIAAWRYPALTPKIRALLASWNLDSVSARGSLQGSDRLKDGRLRLVQEGRFGYEQYAARSLFLLGVDVSRAIRYDVGVKVREVEGQRIAYDARLPRSHDGTHNAVLSEPYILEAIEYGLDATTAPLAEAVYRAQRNRWKQTGIVTAVSEDNIDRAPYFVYNSVLNDLKPWAAFTPDGKPADKFRTLSVKAAMGWAYVFKDEYADELLKSVDALRDARGWFSGRYEGLEKQPNRSMTANSNGIVLEVLWYKTRGPLLRYARSQ